MDPEKAIEATGPAEASVTSTIDAEDVNTNLTLFEKPGSSGGVIEVAHQVFASSKTIEEEAAADEAEKVLGGEQAKIDDMTIKLTDEDLPDTMKLKRCKKVHGIDRNVPEWEEEDAAEAAREAKDCDDKDDDPEKIVSIGGVKSPVPPGVADRTKSLRDTFRDTIRGMRKKVSGAGPSKKDKEGDGEGEETENKEPAPKKSWIKRVFSRTKKE